MIFTCLLRCISTCSLSGSIQRPKLIIQFYVYTKSMLKAPSLSHNALETRCLQGNILAKPLSSFRAIYTLSRSTTSGGRRRNGTFSTNTLYYKCVASEHTNTNMRFPSHPVHSFRKASTWTSLYLLSKKTYTPSRSTTSSTQKSRSIAYVPSHLDAPPACQKNHSFREASPYSPHPSQRSIKRSQHPTQKHLYTKPR